MLQRSRYRGGLLLKPPTKSICLKKLLTQHITECHIFLGFTCDGNFLISFAEDRSSLNLHFWLVPTSDNGKLRLFSVHSFNLQNEDEYGDGNIKPIRFIQSKTQSSSFALLISLPCCALVETCSRDVVWIIFGQVPNLSCDHCNRCHDFMKQHCASLVNSPKDQLRQYPSWLYECPIHTKHISIRTELESLGDVNLSRQANSDLMRQLYGEDSEEEGSPSSLFEAASKEEQGIALPNCVARVPGECFCQDPVITWLGIQPSVCPRTGLLRLLYFCGINQSYRLLSAQFINSDELPVDGGRSVFVYPQGGFVNQVDEEPIKWPLIQVAKRLNLVTQNYCPYCFANRPEEPACNTSGSSMPESCLHRCLLHPRVTDRMFVADSFDCYQNGLLTHDRIDQFLLQKGSNDSPIEEQPQCPLNEPMCKECQQFSNPNCLNPLSSHLDNNKLRQLVSNPPFFSERSLCFSCKPVNFIASCQDINSTVYSSLVSFTRLSLVLIDAGVDQRIRGREL
ncbi:hypothetical protein Ciccas_009996 [Cichlidogyrus casuarinus]|uniref:DDB1- and CUL4-associated factor 15 WD40 repeat-containing domain-containing protein n=1 Tax=Cichlidogyrus casuarinus TaxID=1844966 RepID=A0ABD2PWY5_9PLAT